MTLPITFGAPGRYYQGPGLIETLGEKVQPLGKKIALVTDPLVAQMLADTFAKQLAQGAMCYELRTLDGDLTLALADELAASLHDFAPDIVIAAGGGRGLDAGKAVANRLGKPVITLPTSASTDSPTSKNYVLYNDLHLISAVEHMPKNPEFVLVDTQILASAPAHLLRYGIGDAIAKKFEARQCRKANGLNMFGAHPSLTAGAIADACFNVLREHAEAALLVAGTGQSNHSFEAVVEANILLAGLGFESGGLSLAHGLTRALSLFPGAQSSAHGCQVAYCLMVQLSLEADAEQDFKMLWDWLPKLGLPRTLEELDVQVPAASVLAEAAERALAAPHLRNFERALTADEIINAMLNVGA